MADRYIKVKMDGDDIDVLKRKAKERGMTMSDFVKEAISHEISLNLFLDREFFAEHTQEINELRHMVRKIYFTTFENKILLSEEFKQLEKFMDKLEKKEGNILKELRIIRTALTGKGGKISGHA